MVSIGTVLLKVTQIPSILETKSFLKLFSGSGRLSLGVLLPITQKEFEFESKTVESGPFG